VNNKIVLLGIGVPFTVCLLYLYWNFRPYRVIAIKSLQIDTTVALPGEKLSFTLDYCKGASYAGLNADVYYALIDNLIFSIPGTISMPLLTGCHRVEQTIETPDVPPGKYRLVMRRVYRVNPMRTIEYSAESDEFAVASAMPPIPELNQLLESNQELIRQNQALGAANKQLLRAIGKLVK
jgi:hypothetical protein